MNALFPQILTEAVKAGEDAARAAFESQGRKDVGTCGYSSVRLPKRHPFTEWAQANGHTLKGFNRPSLKFSLPEGVSTQSAAVNQAQGRAIYQALKDAGIEGVYLHTWID